MQVFDSKEVLGGYFGIFVYRKAIKASYMVAGCFSAVAESILQNTDYKE